MDQLEKVKQLINLAVGANGNLEEQKNAALQAVRLIHKCGFVVTRAEVQHAVKEIVTVQGTSRPRVAVEHPSKGVVARPFHSVKKLYELTEHVRIVTEGQQFIQVEYELNGTQTMFLEQEFIVERRGPRGEGDRVLLTLTYDYAVKAGVTEVLAGRIVNR